MGGAAVGGLNEAPATADDQTTAPHTAPLILLALAVVGRLGRRQILYAAGLIGMFILQSVFVALRSDLPMIAALHPMNGFAILLVGILTAREAWMSRIALAGGATAIESTLGVASR